MSWRPMLTHCQWRHIVPPGAEDSPARWAVYGTTGFLIFPEPSDQLLALICSNLDFSHLTAQAWFILCITKGICWLNEMHSVWRKYLRSVFYNFKGVCQSLCLIMDAAIIHIHKPVSHVWLKLNELFFGKPLRHNLRVHPSFLSTFVWYA